MEKIFPLHCGQCELSKVSPGPRVRQEEIFP